MPIVPKMLLSYKQKSYRSNADSLHITYTNGALSLHFVSKTIITGVRLTQMSPVHIYALLTCQRSRPSKRGGAQRAPLAGAGLCPVWGEPPEYGEIPLTEQLSLCRLFVKSALALGEQCAYKESAAC